MADESSLRCRRSKHCGDARPTPVTLPDGSTVRVRMPAWATAPNGLCRMDSTLAHQAIRKLPADYLELSDLLGKTSRLLGTYASSTRDLAVPIRLNVEALQAAIRAEIDIWAAPVAAHSGFVYRATGRGEHHVDYGSGWIIGRWPLLLRLPVTAVGRIDGRDERLSGKNPVVVTHEDGVDGALRLLWLHEQVTAIAGRTHRAERLWSPCPRCDRVALERQEGSGHVDCTRCDFRETLERYEARRDLLACADARKAAVA